MMTPGAQPIVSLSEAQAFLRLNEGDEEALLAGFIRAASDICESFLGQVVVARSFEEEVRATSTWQRLLTTPIRSITQVNDVTMGGATSLLGSTEYDVNLDCDGRTWIKRRQTVTASRLRVSGIAGLASDINGVPEAIRHGVLRMVAHLYSCRDAQEAGPPAMVSALWRPFRRVSVAA